MFKGEKTLKSKIFFYSQYLGLCSNRRILWNIRVVKTNQAIERPWKSLKLTRIALQVKNLGGSKKGSKFKIFHSHLTLYFLLSVMLVTKKPSPTWKIRNGESFYSFQFLGKGLGGANDLRNDKGQMFCILYLVFLVSAPSQRSQKPWKMDLLSECWDRL